MDMRKDPFADFEFGQVALQKLAPNDENFRLYAAGWLGDGNQHDVMEVSGAIFRESTRGPTKGQLSVLVKGTRRTAYVTAEEMRRQETKSKENKRIKKIASSQMH